ncbi:MAG TPA: alpha/beta fold hydrolase [Ktedonobacterales bacterium]|jgi:proline iminopeptidase|nr:alpha/beta fold hydrolase [Ktedonobacterales bacterium]
MDPQHLADEPAPREGFLPVEGATLYSRDIGQGPPVIVLHGGPGFDHNYLLPDLDRLADAFRLIYYDQRGRGKSTWNVPPAPVSLQSEMDDLERVREHFQLEQAAVLGHSWGGLLAMEYAIRHPERVSRLILLNTCPASDDDFALFERQLAVRDPEDAERMRVLDSDPRMAEGDLDTRAAYYRLYYQPTLRPPELLDRLISHLQVGWTKESVLTARATTRRLFPETVKMPGYNLLPALARLRVPTLILHGDYDFIPLPCVTHIAEAIPGARLVVVRDCGHYSYLERPDAVRQALDEFFQAA